MKTIQHKFVEFIPEELEDEILYISIEYRTAAHNCACGCGNRVVTPITPTDWKLMFDGKTVSLYPSIGNWSFDCQSHYWIRDNEILQSGKWTKKHIDSNRENDARKKRKWFKKQSKRRKKRVEKHKRDRENKGYPLTVQ